MLVSLSIVLKSVFTRLGDNYLLDFFFSPYIYEFIAGYFICHYWRYLSARHWTSESLTRKPTAAAPPARDRTVTPPRARPE